MKKKLRLIWHIGPSGFSRVPTHITFSDKPDNNLTHITRGEGQAIQFVIEKWDLSTNFHNALLAGDFTKMLQNQYPQGYFEVRFVPNQMSLPDPKHHKRQIIGDNT